MHTAGCGNAELKMNAAGTHLTRRFKIHQNALEISPAAQKEHNQRAAVIHTRDRSSRLYVRARNTESSLDYRPCYRFVGHRQVSKNILLPRPPVALIEAVPCLLAISEYRPPTKRARMCPAGVVEEHEQIANCDLDIVARNRLGERRENSAL